MPVQYAAVKTILDTLIADWTAGNLVAGVPTGPDFPTMHRAAFDWSTAAALKAATARGIPMIQQAVIGQPGQGHTANIVVALTVGVAPFPPMPDGGLNSTNNVYLAAGSREILTIIQWIEDGCLP